MGLYRYDSRHAARNSGWQCSDWSADRQTLVRSCHLVEYDQKGGESADVPTFFAIAKRSSGDTAGLKSFLADPHPPMPDLNLTRVEIDDLLAYIGSLK